MIINKKAILLYPLILIIIYGFLTAYSHYSGSFHALDKFVMLAGPIIAIYLLPVDSFLLIISISTIFICWTAFIASFVKSFKYRILISVIGIMLWLFSGYFLMMVTFYG